MTLWVTTLHQASYSIPVLIDMTLWVTTLHQASYSIPVLKNMTLWVTTLDHASYSIPILRHFDGLHITPCKLHHPSSETRLCG